MVDQTQNQQGPFIQARDVVLPDLPPNAGAFAARALRRLMLRRGLVALAGTVILAFAIFYQLPPAAAISGFSVIAAGAALLPRENVFRQTSPLLRADERRDAAAIIDALLNGLPAPVMLLNARGKLLRFNELARSFFPALAEYEHISRFIRDPGVLEAVSNASAARRKRHVVPYDVRVPIERHMEATITWTGPAAGRTHDDQLAILLHLRDLTEQERLTALRTDFIANASHELRTPLASVIGFIETLQGAARDDAEARARFLDIMAQQAQRMTRLIDDLLSLSRIEMRLHLRPRDPVDINGVVAQVAGALEPVAEKAGVALHITPCGGDTVVPGDRDELVRVFSNLVENAIKYGRSGGNVWLTIEARADGRFAVSCRDDGQGIPEQHLPRLTERFYRASDAGAEKSGTGLGLAIVKNAVARHRGELLIKSEAGKGSTFTVLLTASE